MNEKTIREIVAQVVGDYEAQAGAQSLKLQTDSVVAVGDACSMPVPAEASARHIHLSKEDTEKLFGVGYQLKKKKDISQPGQFLCEERVSLVGEKGKIDNVAVLGPTRDKTQVEISLTDSRILGIKAPIRMSGETEGAASIYIMAADKIVNAVNSVIVAKNHLHMTKNDAAGYGLSDGGKVNIKMNTERPIIFEDVAVRVSDNSRLAFHIDYDEANACGFAAGDVGFICKGSLQQAGKSEAAAPQAAGLSCAERRGAENKQIKEQNCGKSVHMRVRLLTERDLYDCYRRGIKDVAIERKTIITTMAKDYAREKRITVHYI